MRRFLFFLLSVLFFSFTTVSGSLAIVDDQILPIREPRFVADEVIVKYKIGKSPDELKKTIEQKKAKKETFIGFFQILWEDTQMRFRGEETAESILQKLEKVDKEVGVISKKKLFNNTYLMKLKNKNVLEAVKRYKSLPEVEYAEPNYILRIQ